MNRCLVVLGMHRSGTSCVTRMLHHLGVYLGANYCTEPMPSNLIGHWEARDVVEINDQILSLSGGSWQSVPERLTWNRDCEQKIKRVLAQFAVRPLYGWKDPRTTITFPVWKRHLPDYVVLACVRHPLAVAQSLEMRDGFDIAHGLRLWTTYNQHLLAHLAGEREVFWFPYDEPQTILHEHLHRLCSHLRLPCDDEAAALFNPYLRHSRGGDVAVADEAIALYERLLAMSRQSLSAADEHAHFPLAMPETTDEGLLGYGEAGTFATREHSLREVLRNLSAAQQMHTRRMQNIERTSEERLQQICALEERLTRSIEYSTAIERRLFQAEMGLPVNILRRLLARVPGMRPAYNLARRWIEARRAPRELRDESRAAAFDGDNRPFEICA